MELDFDPDEPVAVPRGVFVTVAACLLGMVYFALFAWVGLLRPGAEGWLIFVAFVAAMALGTISALFLARRLAADVRRRR
jgi:hypothetical protein